MNRGVKTAIAIGLFAAIAAVSVLGARSAKSVAGLTPELLENEELKNVIRVSPRILSGAEPASASAFAELKRLGVRTVVSVDSVAPEVELARRFGLRYVHIPIAYDGVHESARRSLVRVVKTCETPLYIHCHHGRHRGPAAAAIAQIADTGMPGSEAVRLMEIAGSSEEFAGLYRDVREFVPPPGNVELPDLFEVVESDSLSTWMAKADRYFDSLRESPAESDALMLLESFRESSRLLAQGDEDAALIEAISNAEATSRLLHESIVARDREKTKALVSEIRAQCVSCHRRFRAVE